MITKILNGIMAQSTKDRHTNTTLEGEKKLSQYCWFKWAIFLSICMPIVIAFVITYLLKTSENPQYELQPTYQGFKNLFIYFEPVFKTAAAFLAIAGLIALIFRSVQTVKQIDQANRIWEHEDKKASFSLFIEHQKCYTELINNIEKDPLVSFMEKSLLYKHCFHNNEIKGFDISLDRNSGVLKYVIGLIEAIHEWNEEHLNRYSFSGVELLEQYDRLVIGFNHLNIAYEGIYPKRCLYIVDFNHALKTLSNIVNQITTISYSTDYVQERSIDLAKCYEIAIKDLPERQSQEKMKSGRFPVFLLGGKSPSGTIYLDTRNPLIKLNYVNLNTLPIDHRIELNKKPAKEPT